MEKFTSPAESEQRYRAIFENAPVGISLLSKDFRILEMNRTMREWFPDIDPEARPLCHASFNSPPLSGPCSWCPAVKVFADGKEHESVTSTPRPDGIHNFRISTSPILDAEGNVSGVIEIVEDLTQRVQAEVALQGEKRFTDSLIRTAHTVILVLELDGRVRSFNPFFEALSGHSSGDMRGCDFFEKFVPDSDRAQARKSFLGTHLGAALSGVVLPLSGASSEASGTFVEWYSAILRGEDGEPSALLFTGQDVSLREHSEREKRALEAQLIHSQKLETIGTLAGGIAHDFNNLLQPILGYVQMAMEDVEDRPEVHAHLKQVMHASQRARDLVKQILTFSRQAVTDRSPLMMQLIVKEAARLLRSTIPSSIEIRQRIKADCSAVLADPTHIHQVVMNICTNAYQAMGSGPGVLEIALEDCEVGPELCEKSIDLHPGRYVRLTVEDSGAGMDAATLSRIFEPFFTTKAFGKGTGLGLSVVHGIVASHGGAVLVESEPGAGTTFEIYFPVCSQAAAPRSLAVEGVENVTSGIRALYVDDEQAILSMAHRMLTRRGVEMLGVTSPFEALEILRRDPARFDVIITDLMMPKMTGAGFANKVFEIRPDVPVILITGFTETPEIGTDGIRPFVNVLHKPVGISELLEAIFSAVNLPAP